MSRNAIARGVQGLRSGGFTLIELLVVMAVLGILAMAALPLAEVSVQRDRERELRRALWEIRDAIDSYKKAADAGMVATEAGGSGFPPSLVTLVAGMPNPKAGGQMQYFLRRVPRDPFADPSLPAERSWGLRSYQSPANAPKPGIDVYDIYSLSDQTGLNGIALKEW
jgi:general secretion pathway protein G